MILNSNTHQAESESIGSEETISMSIDTSDQAALMMILSENLYKDPIGSLIRESASNAFDAQAEAHTTDPIIVKLEYGKGYSYIYSVEDHGTGISPDRVKNILSKYAASTKRHSNEYLGWMGLGFKSPLAYADSFTFMTRYEGTEYQYIMYKGEDGTKIDLVSDKPTTEKSGTTVSIQVKGWDQLQFVTKIRQQLAYFEGVWFEVPGIDNEFKVLKHEDWKYSDLAKVKTMHLCLGDVYYDIDWAKLGITAIELPVGLKFGIEDGLLPIPSREDIKYTEEAKELIKNKIAKVIDYFVMKFNEGRGEVETFSEWRKRDASQSVIIEEKLFYLPKEIRILSDIPVLPPTMKGVKLLNLEALNKKVPYFFQNYEGRGEIKNGRFYGKNIWAVNFIDFAYGNSSPYLLAVTPPKGLDLLYLKDIFPNVRFAYKRWDIELGKPVEGDYGIHTTYRKLLDLENYPSDEWRERIQEFQGIIAEYVNALPKVEDYKPTPEWLQARKEMRAKGKRKVVTNEQITLKIGRRGERGEKKVVFDQLIYPLKEVGRNLKKLIIWGRKEEKAKFDHMLPLILRGGKGNRAAFVQLNNYEVKKVTNLSNFITIEEFMKGKSKPFKVFASAILIRKLVRENHEAFQANHFIRNFSKDLADKMETLWLYSEENYPQNYNASGYSGSDDFVSEALKVATENNLFDEEIMLVYNEVNEKLHFFDFIPVLQWYKSTASSETIMVVRELLRGRRFRMDWQNYSTSPSVVEGDPDDDEEEERDDIEDEIAPIASSLIVVPIKDIPEMRPVDIFEEEFA